MTTFRATKTKLRREQDREIRAALRERRREVQRAIREAKKRKRGSLAKVREQCRRSRARLTERAKLIRAKHREEANREIEPLRDAADRACSTERAKVGKRSAKELQALAERERAARADERRERSTQGVLRKKDRRAARRSEVQEETDAEVAQNLDSELQPVWDQMKGAFRKAPKRKTRTEAFLEWVHDNAAEVLQLQSAMADQDVARMIAEHEREERELARLLEKKQLTESDLPSSLETKRNDADRLRKAILDWGDLKEPEAAAALGWSEERAWKASEQGRRRGLFERSTLNGALMVPGTKGRQERLSNARAALQLAEKKTGVIPARETFKAALARLLDEFRKLGWRVHTHQSTGQKLSKPYVERDDGLRVYFGPQTLKWTEGRSYNSARTLGDGDYRRKTAERLAQKLERVAEPVPF